ncbi:DUF3883 domain-containing protein [Paraconexibacter algicola]|uniref:DUF3883 domain-containing protein n=1 Tax=Paraconexibacter algicola TaxID=2133960 RepID=UPI0011B21222|nr:DUF3883 domain-containing protein [Paraconexibacter algicola]
MLQTSTRDQAWELVRARAAYADVSLTQYGLAEDLLRETGLIAPHSSSSQLREDLTDASSEVLSTALFDAMLSAANPRWLPDADLLVPTLDDLPADAAEAADAVGLSEAAAFLAIERAQRKFDATDRAAVGTAGEQALVELLEADYPGGVDHVSQRDDTLGYDIRVDTGDASWHLEVKSTTRRGRLTVFLSRNEFLVAQHDAAWKLVVVGLREDLSPGAVCTGSRPALWEAAPTDRPGARWETARFDLAPESLTLGLPFLPKAEQTMHLVSQRHRFGWAPATSGHQ